MSKLAWVAYSVVDLESGEKKSRWREIGVGFDNKDGSITIDADAWPSGRRIVLQRPKQADEPPIIEQ